HAPYSAFQGSLWEGNYFYANLHGHNWNISDNPFTELRKYEFDGTNFTFLESVEPPTSGASQGLSKYADYYFWNDRPNNCIVITKSINKANIYAETMPLLREQTVEPQLLNGFEYWDATRKPRVTLKDGIVYLSGMLKVPEGLTLDGTGLNTCFLMPELMTDVTSRNFVCYCSQGAARVAIASKLDTLNGRKVVLGNPSNPLSGVTWLSLDGISYPLLNV
ncbi:hypothetical protein, partial [Metasolibacillus meyeri]|uniref:hypothetical protein n=1 Tax=Metasolibacillus meyeri TaxID=1071052 RepID=UPI00187D4654